MCTTWELLPIPQHTSQCAPPPPPPPHTLTPDPPHHHQTHTPLCSPGYNDLGAIAIQTAEARLLALDGRWEEAAAALQAAAAAEAATGYVEPPRLLHQPLLQCAGWALLHMGRYEEAAEAYRADLAHHRGNAWSLLGLAQALMRSGRSAEAAEARAGFERAWRHADQRITNSCPAFGG